MFFYINITVHIVIGAYTAEFSFSAFFLHELDHLCLIALACFQN